MYVSKRFSAAGTVNLANSRLRLNAYREDRDSQTTLIGGSDRIVSVGLTWTWTIRQRTDLSIDTGWQRFELQTNANSPEDVRLRIRIQRDFRKGMFLNLGVWHGRRGASMPADEYDENGASMGIGKRF